MNVHHLSEMLSMILRSLRGHKHEMFLTLEKNNVRLIHNKEQFTIAFTNEVGSV